MDVESVGPEPLVSRALEELIAGACWLDLEVSHSGEILRLGAAHGASTLAREGRVRPSKIVSELDTFAARATCVAGHNLVRHDLPVLRERWPALKIHRLPVIDTLVLSPICFPENPYHRLVKDYKLVRESANDPVFDARRASVLFADEFRSLAGLRRNEPRVFELLHFLLATPGAPYETLAAGMSMLFRALGGTLPEPERALETCAEVFREHGCAAVPVEKSLIRTAPDRHALAYTIAWLRVAGAQSVLPPWVRLEFPSVGALIRQLREVPCDLDDCSYCRKVHDPREQLRAYFGWDDFRSHPKNSRGQSLQRAIVEGGLRDESLLAILPTGGGKSVCFQLPALVRNYRRGVLTIVISPLQALMKDQVDGLARRTGSPFAAALYGLLTPLERGDVLRRVRMGDIAILYVSPEQLRNRSFRDAIALREIGCWVFDEAHCLSKWGHDFRPDYLYAGRFIREFARKQNTSIPPIACFTATAKRDVKEEILAYFKAQTSKDLAVYEGGVERENLWFEVQSVGSHEKLARVHDVLSDRLASGSAIVFRATRAEVEQTARYLREKGWPVDHFHAGLTPPEKKRVQDEFLAGQTRVICATNAFGMGIDKEDVRLVIHADTPGSLENYLQEAGRAGRDGHKATCLLLFEDADCERQFRMTTFSQLSRRDIAQILRGLRRAARGGRNEIIITTGELLRDQEVETDIELHDRDADTKVRTAIAWLERADFLERDENATQVFQARPLVRDLEEATEKISRLNLPETEQQLWFALLREVFNSGPTGHLTVDDLALLPEFTRFAAHAGSPNPEFVSAKVLKVLGSMAQAGLMKRDMLMNAFVRHRIVDHSRHRFDRIVRLERALIDLLAIEEPDPEDWVQLLLRPLNQRLCDEQHDCSVELIRSLLKSLSQDGRGFAGAHGSIELRHVGRDACRIRLKRSWTQISELADKRRRVAGVALDTILSKVPANAEARADLLVEFSFEELLDALARDLFLKSDLKDPAAALERALMYLHEQHVIVLQQGLAVFRAAMTIRLNSGAHGERYKAADYEALKHHYAERVLQVHVMSEYARRGLTRIQEALKLVLAYFSLGKEEFVRRYFSSRPDLLKLATTAESYKAIVDDLNNPAQAAIVTAPVGDNLLVLAGPGSGKTRTVVHRCAYLLRVHQVRPQSILVCCFNRHAAIELRKRLRQLAGNDAKGVTILTYHALAMRLLGRSFAGGTLSAAPVDFDAIIPDAVKVLRGEVVPAGMEPDETRERLLAGFQHILVDEYQDIDSPQYEMISALAGRTMEDPDLRLSILAVGDDDQNIYAFRGTNVEFIRRFAADYQAKVHYLVENYRSTRCIIDAANQLIALNTDRMKLDYPIRINRDRAQLPPGGGLPDPLTHGRVQIIRVEDSASQAAGVIAKLRRLSELGIGAWNGMAVLSSTHRELAAVRALAEAGGIPIRWMAQRDRMPPLHQLREIRQFLRQLEPIRRQFTTASTLRQMLPQQFGSAALERSAGTEVDGATGCGGERRYVWLRFLDAMLETLRDETGDAEMAVQEVIEFVYETCAESRREFSYGDGVTLSTVHAAKGTEYDHVLLIGNWPARLPEKNPEELRRAFYVGMTRARRSLAIFDRRDVQPSLPAALSGDNVMVRELTAMDPPGPQALWNYEMLGLDGIHLGYPARFEAGTELHNALARLNPGDRLRMGALHGTGVGLFDANGVCVARLSRKAEEQWPREEQQRVREVRVIAMVCRNAEQDPDPERRAQCRVNEWEVPIVEVVSC